MHGFSMLAASGFPDWRDGLMRCADCYPAVLMIYVARSACMRRWTTSSTHFET